MCFVFYGHYIINVFKIYGFETIHDDHLLTFVGSFGSLFNGVCRIFWSTLLDYKPFKTVFGILIVLQLTLIAVINISHYHAYSYLVVVCLSMQCEGALASILPTTVLSVFGLKRGHMVYSIMFSVFGVASLCGGILVKTL